MPDARGESITPLRGRAGARRRLASAAEVRDTATVASREEHGAIWADVEGEIGMARMALTAGRARRAQPARAGCPVEMLDRIVLDDEPPFPGELPPPTASLDVSVVLFRIGDR